MAGFQKAKPQQAALKLIIYGPSGSGKTFTGLLLAEGLARLSGKRVAVIDTERGTDFYAQEVRERSLHPHAWDFDCAYTRSMTETLAACRGLSPETHSVLMIDSVTHLWETCMNSYSGAKTKIESIPMHAWGAIKKPYKELMSWMLASPLHVIICGRMGYLWGKDEDTGELVNNGFKLKAEGETAYEGHILIRMESRRKKQDHTITAFIEKDRTGILGGQMIEWPTFDNLAKPLLRLLGNTQASVDSEEAAQHDRESQIRAEAEKQCKSAQLKEEFTARFMLAKTEKEVDAIAKELTPALKKEMLAEDVTELRELYHKHIERTR